MLSILLYEQGILLICQVFILMNIIFNQNVSVSKICEYLKQIHCSLLHGPIKRFCYGGCKTPQRKDQAKSCLYFWVIPIAKCILPARISGLPIIPEWCFFHYYAISKLIIETENDQVKHFIRQPAGGFGFVIERESCRKRTNCRNVTVTYKVLNRHIRLEQEVHNSQLSRVELSEYNYFHKW